MTFWIPLGIVAAIALASFKALNDIRAQRARLEEMRNRLARENEKMARETEEELRKRHHLLHDPAYIEKVAREDMGYVKPGEISYTADYPEEEDEAADKPAAPEPGKSIIQRLAEGPRLPIYLPVVVIGLAALGLLFIRAYMDKEESKDVEARIEDVEPGYATDAQEESTEDAPQTGQ